MPPALSRRTLENSVGRVSPVDDAPAEQNADTRETLPLFALSSSTSSMFHKTVSQYLNVYKTEESEDVSTSQCENLFPLPCFPAAETGRCDFVQRCLGSCATFFLTECVCCF